MTKTYNKDYQLTSGEFQNKNPAQCLSTLEYMFVLITVL